MSFGPPLYTPPPHPAPTIEPVRAAASDRACVSLATNAARGAAKKKNARAALGKKKPAVEEPVGKAEENKRAAQSSAFVISSPAWLGLK